MAAAILKTDALISHIDPLDVVGPVDGEITDLVYDSRKVSNGCAFFALRGSHVDGHQYISSAVEKGARVIVMEELQQVAGATAVRVENSRRALAEASALFFGLPSRQMQVVGVTGTNGKTTITYVLESILAAAGRRPAVIGTINYRFADDEIESSHTTPESCDLQKIIAGFHDQGADALVMEVSSHALEQYRVGGIEFAAGIFSNLTPEHLDYHLTMDSYFASKKKFFSEYILPQGGRAIINIDDPYGRTLLTEVPNALTCGLAGDADVRAENVQLNRNGICADIITPAGSFKLESELLGGFNVSNLLCAIAAATSMEIPQRAIMDGISRVKVVPGRVEKIENDRDALIMVDYAHTGDALENVLEAVGELEANRIITVFGCGGDRDRSKRAVMGEIAARLSDVVIVTSDNPRSEAPESILAEIIPGVQEHFGPELTTEQFFQPDARGYFVSVDRREALRMAVEVLRPGDLLLVTGKGHEDYQILGKEKIHFDDREEIRQALQRQGGTDGL